MEGDALYKRRPCDWLPLRENASRGRSRAVRAHVTRPGHVTPAIHASHGYAVERA